MKNLISFFKPSLFVDSVLDIDKSVINNPKIKLILLDIDNTIIQYKRTKMQDCFMQWLISVSASKKIILVTNNSKKRVKSIAELKSFNYICRAYKPLPFCYLRTVKNSKIKKDEAIIIGDQIFDDILGGNLAGIYTVLVKPIEMEKAYRIRIKRYFESKILCKMEKKGND